MAVTYPRMRDGYYMGRMTNEQADAILATIAQPVIPVFKKKLFMFPTELVMRSIEEGKSIRRIIHEEKLDYSAWTGELRDEQTVGTAFLYLSPRSILGDGVGAGKTAETAALLNTLKQQGTLTKFLMCVEGTAVGQTIFEMTKFTGLRVIELPTQAADMRKAIKRTDWSTVDGVVMAHSGLRSDQFSQWLSLYLGPDGKSQIFNVFILDESSVVKNGGTKTYDYTQNICNIVPRVHMLNATTFETSIMDIYNQVDMMEPEAMPKAWRIEKEFRTYKSVSFWGRDKQTGKAAMQFRREPSGYKNQEKFKQSLKLIYFGRPRKESPHKYTVVEVEPNAQQIVAINRGHRYMEVLNCPSLIPELKLSTCRENVPKLDTLVKMVAENYAGMGVMVYCFHIEAQQDMANEFEAAGRKPVILNGATPMNQRFEIQAKFNNGEYDVIITNIQKSLNLTGGDVCIIYSQIGNPARMEQVRGRIDRNVDDKQKEYVLMLYSHTPEYDFFVQQAASRAQNARELTIDAKTAVDYFMESMKEG